MKIVLPRAVPLRLGVLVGHPPPPHRTRMWPRSKPWIPVDVHDADVHVVEVFRQPRRPAGVPARRGHAQHFVKLAPELPIISA